MHPGHGGRCPSAGFPEEARHLEYFLGARTCRIGRTIDFHAQVWRAPDKTLVVPADKSIADGSYWQSTVWHVDVKCSDGICGVCKCGVVAGEVEHRDFVLSRAQRETTIITCQSRAAQPGGTIELDL